MSETEIDYAALEAAANESVHWTGVGKNDLFALIAAAKERDELQKEIARRGLVIETIKARHLALDHVTVQAMASRDRLASLLAKAGAALEPFAKIAEDFAKDCDIEGIEPDEDEACRAARSVRDEIKDALSPIAAVHKEGTDAHR